LSNAAQRRIGAARDVLIWSWSGDMQDGKHTTLTQADREAIYDHVRQA
jgi:hypothetical protein